MGQGSLPPFCGWFDEDAATGLDVELLVIEYASGSTYGPWHVGGALIRVPDEPPRWVDGWVDDNWSAAPPNLWEYFVDKRGGNTYSYAIAFLRIEKPDDAPAVINHMETSLAQGNPLGLADPGDDVTVPAQSAAETVFEDDPADPCQDHVHVAAPFAMADAATWQLAVELVRRHPADLWVIRTYPMDGHYDCLSVRRINDVLTSPSVALNRHGTHVQVDRLRGAPSDGDSPLMSWGDAFTTTDPREWIRKVEDSAGLRPTKGVLPPSTRSSIALRWIGMFLSMQLGSRQRWTAWNDWSQIDHGEPTTGFDTIPSAHEWLRDQGDPNAAAHVWFVGTDRDDQRTIHFAVNSAGTLWPTSGKPVDLMAAYRNNGSSISRLVIDTTEQHLP